jgi:hypothetical protein
MQAERGLDGTCCAAQCVGSLYGGPLFGLAIEG